VKVRYADMCHERMLACMCDEQEDEMTHVSALHSILSLVRYNVVWLKRIRFSEILLGDLPLGAVAPLTKVEREVCPFLTLSFLPSGASGMRHRDRERGQGRKSGVGD
jgi:hypothetical protein